MSARGHQRSYINQLSPVRQYESGRVTTDQFYRRDARASPASAAAWPSSASCFADIFVPIEPMIELQAALRRQGLPAYVFSNTNDLAVGHIRRNFPFYANFDGYILSYEHGVMKPDAGFTKWSNE